MSGSKITAWKCLENQTSELMAAPREYKFIEYVV